MLIKSTWRVKLGGVMLLDFGDWTEGEPTIRRNGVVDTVNPIRAPYARFFPRGNVSHTLSFSRTKLFDSYVQSRAFLLTHAVELWAGAAADCVIYISESDLTQSVALSGAVLQPSGYSATTESQKFIAQYELIGGAITGSEDIMIAVTDYLLTQPSAAGNTDVPATPAFVDVKIEPTAGVGAYTRTIALLAPTDDGSERDIYIEIPASVNPTIEIRNLTSAGTLLHTETGIVDGVTHVRLSCKWTGTAWVKWGPAQKQIV